MIHYSRLCCTRSIAGAVSLLMAMLFLVSTCLPTLANVVTVNGVSIETNLPQARRGVYYDYLLSPTGNDPYSSYSLIGGALPQGINLNTSTGQVSGVYCGANTNGSFPWDLTVSGANIPGGSATFDNSRKMSLNMTAGPARGLCDPNMGGSTPNGAQGTPYTGQITSTPPSGSPETFTYSITSGSLPAGLVLDPNTGAISGTPTVCGGPYAFTVTATGNFGSTSSQPYTISSIACAGSIVLGPSSLPSGTVSQPYAQTVTATGGTAGYTYTLSGGSLPSGLTLNSSTGEITGTPSTAATYNFTVQATDSTAGTPLTTTQSYSVTINAAATPLVLSASPSTGLSSGGSASLSTTGGSGTGSITYSVVSGPCTIIGSNVTSTGAGTCVLQATKAGDGTYGTQTSNQLSLNFALATQATLSVAASPASITTTGTSTLSTSGGSGTGAVTYTVVSGPCTVSGTTLTPSGVGTCVVSATKETDGVYATANSTNTASVTVNLAPQSALTVIASPTSITTLGTSTLSTGGGNGTGAITYTVVSGPCTVSGATLTPTGTGTCVVSATKAADSNYAAVTSNQVSVTVGLAPQTTALILSATRLALVPGGTSSLSTTGGSGNGAVTYSVISGPCSVAGNIVTATGVGSCVVRATKAADTTYASATSNDVTISVTPPLSITTATIAQPVLARAYTQPIATTGGTGPITCAVTAGALPIGLTLNPNTCTISGVPTSGLNYSFQITATDANGYTDSRNYSGTLGRPNPASDQNVRGIVSAQAASALRFARGQMGAVQQRLEALHEEDTDDCIGDDQNTQRYRDVCVTFNNRMRVTKGEPSHFAAMDQSGLPTQNGTLSVDGRPIDPNQMGRAVQQAGNLTGSDLDGRKQSSAVKNSAPFGTLSENTTFSRVDNKAKQGAKSNSSTRRSPVTPIKINIWTAGSIETSRVTNNYTALGTQLVNKTANSNITIGIDTRLFGDLKGGVAFGFGTDRTKVGVDGSSSNAVNKSVTVYASQKLLPTLFLDGLAGYGDMRFTSNRYNSDAGSMFKGSRHGTVAFASVSLTTEQKWGQFKFAPYARLEIIQASLDAYSEDGNPDWTLSFKKAQVRSTDLSAGVKMSYDIPMSWGTLTPVARVQYKKMFTGSMRQVLGYTIDQANEYSFTDNPASSWNVSGSAGLMIKGHNGVAGGIEAIAATGGGGYKSFGTRANVRVPF